MRFLKLVLAVASQVHIAELDHCLVRKDDSTYCCLVRVYPSCHEIFDMPPIATAMAAFM
jgi:hypothetical protein